MTFGTDFGARDMLGADWLVRCPRAPAGNRICVVPSGWYPSHTAVLVAKPLLTRFLPRRACCMWKLGVFGFFAPIFNRFGQFPVNLPPIHAPLPNAVFPRQIADPSQTAKTPILVSNRKRLEKNAWGLRAGQVWSVRKPLNAEA